MEKKEKKPTKQLTITIVAGYVFKQTVIIVIEHF